jgi:hypothetical protein
VLVTQFSLFSPSGLRCLTILVDFFNLVQDLSL